MTPDEYWRSGAGLSDITPSGLAWPEGSEFPGWLMATVGDSSVFEVGCGTGRLAKLFEPRSYVGMDLCPEAIERARSALPWHAFAVDDGTDYPDLDVTLFHTVLLHVADSELRKTVARITGPRVLVSEILGRRWRRTGTPPVFNREAGDYVAAFSPRYKLVEVRTRPYLYYRGVDLSMMEFRKC